MFPHRDETRCAALERQARLIERGYELVERALARVYGSAAALATVRLASRECSPMSSGSADAPELRSRRDPRLPPRANAVGPMFLDTAREHPDRAVWRSDPSEPPR